MRKLWIMASARDNQDNLWLPDALAAGGNTASPVHAPASGNGLLAIISHIHERCGDFIRAGADGVTNLIYPPSCLACRAATSQPDGLCAQCWGQIRLIEQPYCERLGTPFALDLGAGLISPQAFADPPVYTRARAVACFGDGPIRELVHRLKYGDRVELARPMGRWMARAGAGLLADADLLVPVPLHRTRLFTRRFNQAALLAQETARFAGASWNPQILQRVKPTAPQVGKSRAQRADNVQGAFRVDDSLRPKIAGKTILLVDDVLTSGATANAAARILLRAGAAQVDVLVFARVVQDL